MRTLEHTNAQPFQEVGIGNVEQSPMNLHPAGTQLAGGGADPLGGSQKSPPWAWVVVVVAALIAGVAVVALLVQGETNEAAAPSPAQSAAPAQAPSSVQSAPPAADSGTQAAPATAPASEATAPPAEEVEAVPASSSDVVIENATVDANGTVTVYGYAVETGLTAEEIEALITYAGEVVAALPVATNGQNFSFQWKPGTIGTQVNLRELGANGVAGELAKYQVSVLDKRHPAGPASVGFKPKTPQLPSRPDSSGPSVQVPSAPGVNGPSRSGGGARR